MPTPSLAALSPHARVLGSLALIFGLVVVAFSWQGGSVFAGLLLVPLGVVVGPVMALTFPFPVATKVALLVLLLCAAALVGLGFRRLAQPHGQVALVIGVVLWAFVGLMGLGTGT